MPLLPGQVSLSACASAAVALCVSALFTSWSGGSGPSGDAARGLLSSLYSNDRPCCFTCCGGWSVALSLHPLAKTRTQVLPVGDHMGQSICAQGFERAASVPERSETVDQLTKLNGLK